MIRRPPPDAGNASAQAADGAQRAAPGTRSAARDPDDMGPTTWLDGVLAEAGQQTSPVGLTGLPTTPAPITGDPERAGRGAVRPRVFAAAPLPTAFDACQGGVMLRALLFVHGVIALGLAFGSAGWADWAADLGLAVAGALPATLLWLIAVCAAQARWTRWPVPAQWAAMSALGAACAAATWIPLRLLELAPVVGMGAWAPLAAGAAFGAAIFHWLSQRARLQLPATTMARLAELQSRIRPHFLFNALNTAVALVRLDPQRAEEVLEDLSELFRAALVGSGEQVTLGEEVELAQRYLAIEQVRFGQRLKVSWQVDPRASAARVPSLVLQPLVENAVKHGVEAAAEGGEIQIRTQVHKGQALISITNSVPSGPGRRGQGMALHNVRERLLLLHDLTMRFEAGAVEGGRYRVRIAVPLPG